MLSLVDHKDDDTEPTLTLAHLDGLDLRRNDEYRRDYQTIALAGAAAARNLEEFAHHWGLRFPVRSRRAA